MIRPYLRDLINEDAATMELNNNNSNNNNNDTDCGEWKIQLTMQNSCISSRSFEDKRTIYSKSKPVEIYMGSDTENVIDTIFNMLLQKL